MNKLKKVLTVVKNNNFYLGIGFDSLQEPDVQSIQVDNSANAVKIPDQASTTERPSVSADQSGSSSRFAKVKDDDLQQIIDGSLSKATNRNTVWGVKLFREWLQERGYPSDFENFDAQALNTYLRSFYAEVRNGRGEMYSKSTFVGLRAAINRHLRSPPYERDINIMNDKDFHTTNNVFISMVRKMKKEGLDKTKHHAAIPATELAMIRESFDLSLPVGLFNKVWFDITLGFARRGNENQASLRSSSFQVSVDEDGCEYIEMTH
ncbi:uncharacterized protein LOC124268121 [Haliotis rubra]|uniref:uncharacterized protein LOC124268121 n=1 Tax=Haliotis rubra TaxID=36100 RepID=UPI001EE53BA4|nr:uncharacterized protein LOC124268121 [Haliotis rubra]